MTAMDGAKPISHVTPSERVPADPTPGIQREQAISVDGLWAGLSRTEGHMTSGWHHHGEHDSTIYVVSGVLRMESGPGGTDVVEARAGDFVHVPKGAIHREGNPIDEESQCVVVRAGSGPTTINVDDPAPG